MKSCKKCQVVKPFEEFYVNKQLTDGYTNACKECVRERSRLWVAANPERHKDKCRAYAAANPEKRKANSAKWVEENRERSREIKAAWKKRNPETVNRHAREGARRNPEKVAARKKIYRQANPHVAREYQRKRRAENVNQRVNDAMGNRFRDVLRSNKGGRSWKHLAGYDVHQLKSHLEGLFVEGMTWDNYGEWHIDHVRPVASFDFTKDLLSTVRACWALSNLQPLWALDNIRKGKKWDGE